MKVTIEDVRLVDGTATTVVFSDVEDAYVAVRSPETYRNGDAIANMLTTKSYSYGVDIRELLKELRQSIVELEDHVKEQRNANSSGV